MEGFIEHIIDCVRKVETEINKDLKLSQPKKNRKSPEDAFIALNSEELNESNS